MKTSKALTKTQSGLFLLGLILVIGYLASCKSPESPAGPAENEPQYRDVVEEIYTRDVSKADPDRIFDPYKKETISFEYALYDLSNRYYDEGEIYIETSKTRIKNGKMEMISENKFRLFLKHVLIQQEDWSTNHKLILHDHVFLVNERLIEPKDVEIEGAYDIVFDESTTETFNAKILFKMSKE